jgi:hypothetical protein
MRSVDRVVAPRALNESMEPHLLAIQRYDVTDGQSWFALDS